MHKTKSKLFFSVLITVIFGFFFSTFFCVAAYIKYLENSDGAFGSIGLRSYFHCGNGTKEDPYVITRPRHLYNLSRLQSLGVFSEKKYFQLGYDLNNDGKYEFYSSDTGNGTSDVLDMSKISNSGYEITNIGNEANPFYGEFEGMGLEIKGLTVHSDLEDSGLFGYVASRGVVKNLILDNVTIVCDGYSSTFDSMYSDASDKSLKSSSSIIVMQGKRIVNFSYGKDGKSNVTYNSVEVHDYTTNTFSFQIDPSASQDDNKSKMPEFSFLPSNNNYSLLSSDVFFEKINEKGEDLFILKSKSSDVSETSDVSDIFSYFDSYKNKTDVTYPLTLTQTMSLVASKLDTDGINHSKVVSALNVSFEKLNKDSPFITMYVQPRQTNHSNNMGLVIGHCDGSCLNVYVHNGTFKMNTNTASNMRNVSQNSMTGFIGLIGPSVMNNANLESKGNVAASGKDVGVLDFTDIYNSVVQGGFTENQSTDIAEGITYYTYEPKPDNEYMEYLRYYDNSKSIKYSLKNNAIALIGKKVIKDDDNHNRGLGVFTLATDYRPGGIGTAVFLNANSSNIIKSKFPEKSASTSTYFKYDSENVFYSTFEYKKENYDKGIYDKTKDGFGVLQNTLNNNSHFFVNGYHIPLESSVNSMDLYEAYYNYLFRFKLDENRNDFYFSDLDSYSLGGKFLNNYFSNKLIDEKGNPIEVGSSQFGLMIKDKKRKNIGQLTTCFPLDCFSLDGSEKRMFVQGSNPDPHNYVVSNSINFEIKTDYANVTILATNNEQDSNTRKNYGSLLGIYKLPSELEKPDGQSAYVPCNGGDELTWSNPDYAMALVANSAIDFFEYNGGKIGSAQLDKTYFSNEQEVTKDRNNLAIKADLSLTNYLASPIFAHTFKLPRGRYCLGSAYGKASVYYICAQGQDEGDLSLTANAFSNVNKVENMDFLKEDSQSATKENKPYFSIENKEVKPKSDNINVKRCFLIFDSGNVSHFRASSKNNVNVKQFVLEMKYESGQFKFSIPKESDLTSIESLTITNYGSLQNIGATQTKVNLFGTVKTDRKIVYKT